MTNDNNKRTVFDFNVIKALKQKISNSKPIEKEMLEEFLSQYKKGSLELLIKDAKLFVKIPEFNSGREIPIDSILGEIGSPLENIK